MKKVLAITLMFSMIIMTLTGCVTEKPTSELNKEATNEVTQAVNGAVSDKGENPGKPIKICHSGIFFSHEFQQRMIKGMKYYCDAHGYDLTVADSKNDIAKQISDIEGFITSGADIITLKPVDVHGLDDVVEKCNTAGIPVIVQGDVIKGMTATAALNHTLNGGLIAQYVYDYFKKTGEKPVILSVDLPEMPTIVELETGFINKLDELGLDYDLYKVNGKGMLETSLQQAQDALTAHPDINCVFGINDDSAFGAYQAFSTAGIDTDKVLFVSQGIEGNAAGKAIMEDGVNFAACAIFAEYYAINFVSTAVAAYKGEPYDYYAWYQSFMVDRSNYSTYYTKDENGDYVANLETIIPAVEEATRKARELYPDYTPAA